MKKKRTLAVLWGVATLMGVTAFGEAEEDVYAPIVDPARALGLYTYDVASSRCTTASATWAARCRTIPPRRSGPTSRPRPAPRASRSAASGTLIVVR